MDKITAQKLMAAADGTADAIITARHGYFDILDPELGAEYDRIVYGLLAENIPDMILADFMALLW
ncbi:hypothetical protein [Paraburkholderia caledonica]|uniref:hypothetical protein n=1 Tax=Paraburkholderia caledonica TaxID=134536 RepID=UPI000370F219|nr:hypothetical protein [Paraburkholderia caledonica]